MVMGTPPKYNKDVQKRADAYIYGDEKNKAGYIQLDHVVPSIQGLAEWLDLSDKTMFNWIKDEDKKDFLHTYEKVLRLQHNITLGKGLTGDFNSAITKLLLHNHGYTDKVENNNINTEKGVKKIEFVNVEEAERAYREALKGD